MGLCAYSEDSTTPTWNDDQRRVIWRSAQYKNRTWSNLEEAWKECRKARFVGLIDKDFLGKRSMFRARLIGPL